MKTKIILGFLVVSVAAIFVSHKLYKPKVFDCFLFFNEFDVLDIRLNELNDKVDKFILVESTRGFVNNEKPLYFQENKERYAKFLHKIVHVVVDEFPEFSPVGSSDYWDVDNFQRDQIMKGLQRCHPHQRDIVMITDLDEIVKNGVVKRIVDLIDKKGNDVVFCELEGYQFFLNRKIPGQKWFISTASSWGTLSKYIAGTQSFRNLSGFSKGHAHNGFDVLEEIKKRYPHKKWAFARIRDAGWHFSSLGNFAHYMQKIVSYAHVGVNCEYNRNIDNVRNQVSQLEWCEITDHFPKYVLANQEQLAALIDRPETTFH